MISLRTVTPKQSTTFFFSPHAIIKNITGEDTSIYNRKPFHKSDTAGASVPFHLLQSDHRVVLAI